MGGLNFIHYGFLTAGALAVAVPVAIHLLFRQKPRRVEVGSLHFLKVVLRDHVRRRKVRRWVLLALRVAGVLLLALLFARPFWVGPMARGEDREVVLLIDRSASMAAEVAGRSAFRRAQDEAQTVLKNLPERTVAHLAYGDADGVEPAAELTIDRALKPGYSGTDYGKDLAWARDLMMGSNRGERKVYLFTDLQRSGTGRAPLEGWPPGVTLEVVDAGKPVATNLAVTDVAVSRSEVRPGEPFVVSAVVSNTGLFAAQDVPVSLSLSGPGPTVQKTQRVTVGGESRQVVTFPIDAIKPGVYQGSVLIDARDPFPLDDRRWIAFEARAIDRVVLVDGAPGPSVFSGETYYLETALRLRPPGAKATGTPYDPATVPWSPGKPLPDLTGVRAVVLCNVGELADADLSALREYVVSGGALVIFSGDQVTAGECAKLRASKLFPAEFVENAEPGSFRLASWEKDHPLFRPFADPQHGDLRMLDYRRITRLKPDPGVKVLAAAQTGDPLLIEGALGTGKILLFAVAADRDWGDWPVHRLYLPLVHQVLGYLTDRLPETRRSQALLAGPGRENPPGVERSKNLAIARNLDPRESEIERITPKELRLAYRLPDAPEKPSSAHADAVLAPPDAQRPDELWRSLVWGLFAILVLESFVANRTQA